MENTRTLQLTDEQLETLFVLLEEKIDFIDEHIEQLKEETGFEEERTTYTTILQQLQPRPEKYVKMYEDVRRGLEEDGYKL